MFRLKTIACLLALLTAAVVLNWQPDAEAHAYQQPAAVKATPTPTPAATTSSLSLTASEVKEGVPLYDDLQSKQRDLTLAFDNLRRAARQPNNKDAHSQAALATNAALENADTALAKWQEWLEKTAAAHQCKDCVLNLEKKEFTRPPAGPTTSPESASADGKPKP